MIRMKMRQHFRMPLHAQAESHSWMAECFDYAVRTPRKNLKMVSWLCDGLMVKRIHFHFILVENRTKEMGSGGETDAVPDLISHSAPLVLAMPDFIRHVVRDVLMKRSPLGDAHHLDAATDAQGWKITLDRDAEGGYLERVAFFGDAISSWMDGSFIEAGGIYIAAPAEQKSIDTAENGLDVPFAFGQNHGNSASCVNCVGIRS